MVRSGLLCFDDEKRCVFANRAASEILGLSPEQLIGRNSDELLKLQALRQDNRPADAGRKDIAEISFALSFDNAPNGSAAAGAITMLSGLDPEASGLVRDCRESMLLFRRAEKIRMEWEIIMDRIGDAVFLLDRNDVVNRCNHSAKKVLDKDFSRIIGRNIWTLLRQSGIDAFHADKIEVRQEDTGKWFVLDSYELGENGKGPLKTVLTLYDSTALKRTHELEEKNALISESREKLKTALVGISALIQKVVEGKGFNVRFQNPYLPKCYEVLSCEKQDCPCYGGGQSRCWQKAGTYCGGKVQGAFAEKIKNCSECTVFKEATKDPIYEIGEHFNNMMHLLELNNRKLTTAYAELKSAQSKILQQEKMAAIGQLAAGVAHEINNPIAFVMSNLNSLGKYAARLKGHLRAQSEALEAISRGQDASAALGRVDEAARLTKIDSVTRDIETLITESLEGTDRVRQIVQNLKNFSHVDESEFKYADINAGLSSTINIVWNELKYKADLEKELGDIPLIKCNPGQLNQVFLNLLVNAAQAMEKHGRLKVRSWRAAEHVCVSVSDTGCGIPPENIPRIFDPFFTTKEVGKGTGLGLSIAYDIVKKHRGEITAESVAGAGTTFTVKIPIGLEDLSQEAHDE